MSSGGSRPDSALRAEAEGLGHRAVKTTGDGGQGDSEGEKLGDMAAEDREPSWLMGSGEAGGKAARLRPCWLVWGARTWLLGGPRQ